MVKVAAQITSNDMDSKKLISWAQHSPNSYHTVITSTQNNTRNKEEFNIQDREPLNSMFSAESRMPVKNPLFSISKSLGSIKERGRLLVKTVSGAFEKVDGERSKCPRCKGSGLLNFKPWWKFNFKQTNENPCWFCLGVGVMPVLDLFGLLIARNPPIFKTKDAIPYQSPPILFQSYIGKYPAARCHFSCYRLSKELKQSLTVSSPTPSVSTSSSNANEEIDHFHSKSAAVSVPDTISKPDSFASSSGMHKSSVSPSIMDRMPKFSNSYKGSKQNVLQYEDVIDHRGENMNIPHISTMTNPLVYDPLFDHPHPHPHHPSASASASSSLSPPSNSNANSGLVNSPPDHRIHSSEHSFHNSPNQTRYAGSAEPEPPFTSSRYQGSSPVRNHSNSNSRRYFSSSNPSSPSSSPPGSPHRGGHRRWSQAREEGGSRGAYAGDAVSPPRSPSAPMESPRSRSPRKERNRIREKAERDAVERARRMKRPSSPRSSSSASTSSPSSPKESRNANAAAASVLDPSMDFAPQNNHISFWKSEIDLRRRSMFTSNSHGFINGTNVNLPSSARGAALDPGNSPKMR